MASPRRVLLLALLSVVASACSATISVEVTPAEPVETGGPDSTATPEAGSEGGQETIETGRRAVWTDASCEFGEPPDVASNCGWLEVPEHWDDPDDTDTLRLHVGIFSAGPTDTEPVVYLEGGPGGDALANIDQSFDALFGELVTSHDIVIIGQRGTGSAEPTLSCENVTELDIDLLDEALDPTSELSEYEDAYVRCAQDLRDAGIDPSAYNSVENAHDVDALREALGYERWNVLGISYGTRLAQTLMRLHPDGLRSAVLDSVLAYEREPNLDIPVVAKRSFEVLFEGCRSSAVCSARYGDLEARFFALVDQLDSEPISFTVNDVFSGEQFAAAMNGTGLIETTFSALYSKASFAGLPELVEQLERGDTSGVETLVSQEVTSWPFFAEGMYWAVQCREEIPFLTDADEAAGQTGDMRYDSLVPEGSQEFFSSVCGALATGSAPVEEDELLVSPIPTLLLAGTYDPITPPADTESLLAGLENAQYVELPHTGHAALVDDCAQELVLSFLAEPTAVLDTACVADIDDPDWSPDIFEDVDFAQFTYDASLVSGSGVAPVGWEEGADGVFVLADNSLHVSVLLQQAVAGLPPAFLIDNLRGLLGSEVARLGPVSDGRRDWDHYEAIIPGSVVDIFVVEDGEHTLFVLFQHAPADRDTALEVLTGPVLSAFGA